jgi:hypothetical protein
MVSNVQIADNIDIHCVIWYTLPMAKESLNRRELSPLDVVHASGKVRWGRTTAALAFMLVVGHFYFNIGVASFNPLFIGFGWLLGGLAITIAIALGISVSRLSGRADRIRGKNDTKI